MEFEVELNLSLSLFIHLSVCVCEREQEWTHAIIGGVGGSKKSWMCACVNTQVHDTNDVTISVF